ncbi:hypothetical protein, partial [Parabacteroides merdae]|uniref:hypothetical protein n=1 Tax=Parabacteroides merdae TaxID=46503 RepID=UPI0034A10DA9
WPLSIATVLNRGGDNGSSGFSRRVRTARLTARYISTKGFAETSSGRLSAGADGCAGCGAGCLSFIITAGVEIL